MIKVANKKKHHNKTTTVQHHTDIHIRQRFKMINDFMISCNGILVGDFNPSEKYESVGTTIPNARCKNIVLFQITDQHIIWY